MSWQKGNETEGQHTSILSREFTIVSPSVAAFLSYINFLAWSFNRITLRKITTPFICIYYMYTYILGFNDRGCIGPDYLLATFLHGVTNWRVQYQLCQTPIVEHIYVSEIQSQHYHKKRSLLFCTFYPLIEILVKLWSRIITGRGSMGHDCRDSLNSKGGLMTRKIP